MRFNGLDIVRLNHACFIITGSRIVYTDPFQITGGPIADLILVSHEHFDHFSPDDLRKISGGKTVFVAGEFVGPQMPPALDFNMSHFLAAGHQIEVDGIVVKAVPAYNVNKFKSPGEPFHPRGEGRVGFIFEIDGTKIYYAGDTDLIPEMGQFGPIDVALLPVSGTYVMTPKEAAEAVSVLKPKIAIPMHYGAIVGSIKDAEEFKKLSPSRVEII